MNSAAHDKQSSSDDPTVIRSGSDPGSVLVRLMEECLVKLEAGEAIDRDGLVADHPELESQLDACLASLQFIHRAVQPGEGMPARLADFRIIREVGRGGMGVVYEAEQISLKRRVALKVLRFGAVADQEAMQRFQREAETIAALHHTNIVPVFAVGVEKSIHYYAMQFIEGQCLREIAQDTARQPIPDKTIARWGLQAAEALAHAHEHNVVHRDIKPSNLILGSDGRIWLTDFGLAKRLDDVTLSLCGALLGTPRYMSPEQASSIRHPVDHRTDIYSLGATLYELVTGRPLFESESPHVVISQILTVEPRPPREFAPRISRDLETIILKCLCKDASRRYQSAQELADDLRAFEEGRSIKARRATAVELAGRWVRQNRSLLAGIVTTIAVTVVFVTGLSAWWQQRVALRNGSLTLKTREGPLTAEVLTVAGEPVVPAFTVPNEQPVAIPQGEYRLRVSGRGGLSKSALFDLRAGQSQELDVDIRHAEYCPPIPLNSMTGYEFIDFGDGPDLLVLPESPNPPDSEERKNKPFDPRLLRRISRSTGKEVWSLDISQHSKAMKPLFPDEKTESLWWMSTVFGWKLNGQPPQRVLRPLLDLDADGVPDLVWRLNQGFSLFAVSGKSGQPLWWRASSTVEGGARSHFEEACLVEVLQPGGNPVPVVVFTEIGPTHEGKPSFARLVAINAKDNSSLWTTELAAVAPKLALASVRNGPHLVAVVDDEQVSTFDVITGMAVGKPLRWGQSESKPTARFSIPKVIDLDHDGLPELLLKCGDYYGNRMDLRTVSLSPGGPVAGNGRPDWVVPLTGQDVEKASIETHDLNGDGVQEVVVVLNRSDFDCRVLDGRNGKDLWRRQRPGNFFNARYSPAVVGDDLDGDGWREIFTLSVEPDDPRTFHDGPHSLFADCASGKTGTSLWWSRTSIPGKPNSFLHPFAVAPIWRSQGIDGQPGLVATVFLETDFPRSQGMLVTIGARDGAIQEIGTDIAQPYPIDLNGDGRDELTVVHLTDRDSHNHDLNYLTGELRILQSENPIAWRRFGSWQPLMDLDGDGINELWQPNHRYGGLLPIVNGRDGKRFQEWKIDHRASNLIPQTDPLLDLDGDGLAEILAANQSWSAHVDDSTSQQTWLPIGVSMVGSRDQKVLWTGPMMPFPKWEGISTISRYSTEWNVRDLDGDNAPEIVVPYSWNADRGQKPSVPARCQYCLAVLDARTGKLKWNTPLLVDEHNEHHLWHSTSDWAMPLQFGDLDGDGVQDVLMSLAASPWHQSWSREMVVQAISGRDGHLLWPEIRAKFHLHKTDLESLMQVAVADIDGKPGDEVVRFDFLADATPPADGEPWQGHWAIDVLDGRSGQPIYSKRWPGIIRPGVHSGDMQRILTLRQRERAMILVTKAQFDPYKSSSDNVDWLLTIPEKAGQRSDGVPELTIAQTSPARRDDRAWKLDLLSDDIEELVFWRANESYDGPGELIVSHGLNDVLWQRTIPKPVGYSHATIKSLDKGKTLLVSTGQTKLVLSAEGKLLSQFTTPKDAGIDVAPGVADWAGRWADGKPPRIIAREGSQVRSDLILPTDERGRVESTAPSTGVVQSQRSDPRIARRLPWVRDGLSIGVGSMFFGAGLMLWLFCVAPFGLIRWGWRERRRSWPLVVTVIGASAWVFGIWQIVSTVRPNLANAAINLVGLGMFIVAGLPLALAPQLVLRWFWTRDRRALIGIVTTIILATAATAVATIWYDAKSMHVAERYVSDGWYQILLPGSCIGLWLALVLRSVWLSFAAVVKACRRNFRPQTT